MSDKAEKGLSLRERAQWADHDYKEQMLELEKKKKRDLAAEFIRRLRSADILEDEQIEVTTFQLTEQYEFPSVVIDGLRFIGYGYYDYDGPEMTIRLLGKCPQCGQETISDPITNLISLFAEIEKFTPNPNHVCC